MKPRKVKPKTVNVAIPEALHKQLLHFASLFNMPIGVTAEIVVKNGFKNIVAYNITKLQKKIEMLQEFNND